MFKGKKVLSILLAITILMTSFSLPVSADSANVTENVISMSPTESGEPEATAPDASEATNTESNLDNITPATTPASTIAQAEPAAAWNKTIVEIDHGHTVAEVVEMIQNHPHSGFDYYKTTSYEESPKFYAPYSAGSLMQKDIADAENAMKVVRFLAGVPYEDVTFSDELNNIAQHGSVLLAASNQFSHGPTQPEDMSDDFFSLGYQGCSEANISAGRSNISNSVLGFMYDSGANNIVRAGHRRWILNPGNQEFGIGYADGPDASYGGHRINMHVFAGLGYWECESDSYIAWPSDGAFPIQYLAADEYIDTVIDCPWSINLGSPYAEPSKDTVVLKLTRVRDGKTWTFDKNTPNLGEDGYYDDSKLHLAVDNGGYGMIKAIIFRPDPESLGVIEHGDVFKVELSGIKYTDGSAATLSYDISFFDLEKVTNGADVTFTVEVMGTPLADAIVTIDEQTFTTDENGQVTLSLLKNQEYEYHVTKDGYTEVSGTITPDGGSNSKEIVLKKVVTFTIKGTYVPYNGSPQSAIITLNPNVSHTVTYNGSSDLPADAGVYDVIVFVTEEGYTGQAATKMTITPAEIEVTADTKSKKLGSDDPALTYQITSGQLYGNDTLIGALSRTDGEDVGTYKIQQGTLQANDNYKLTFIPADFMITDKAIQNVTVGALPTVTYGDDAITLEVTPDADTNLTDFTYNSSNTNVAEISENGIITIKNAGTTDITVYQPGNDTYAAFTYTQKLVVNPKAVVIRNLDLDAQTATCQGLLPNDASVTLDFSKLIIEVIEQMDETTAKVHVSNFVLKGENAANYTVTTNTLQCIIKTEAAAWQNPFIDVSASDWYYKSVEYAYKNNLFSGLTATQFGPNVSVTRGMLVTVLWRAEGKPSVSSGSQFTDVYIGAYYEKAVIWAEQNGIVSGYSDTVFAPDAPILREQIASIFHRYARYKGLAVKDTDNTALTFTDAKDISSYAVESIQYCVSKNIMYGRTTDIFKPLDHATRAEMAAILQRFLTKIQSGEL